VLEHLNKLYVAYKFVCADVLEHLNKLYVAYKFVCAEVCADC